MRVVAISTLRDFWAQPGREDAKGPLQSWHAVAVRARWASPADIKAQYGGASIVGNNRMVFNIAGNKYRLIVAFAYRVQVAYVKFIGTHAENGRIDTTTVDNDGVKPRRTQMEIKPIRTDADYRAMLREVSKLVDLDPEAGTPEGDRLDVLATLVEAYERKQFPMSAPDPIEAIKFSMEQQGLTA